MINTATKIAIVDYGMGNLNSVLKSFSRIGADAFITSNIDEIRNAGKIVLPGVGHFKTAMDRLNNSGLRNILDDEVLVNKKPVLGICLGMQLFTNYSEEGNVKGLGWINAETKLFRFDIINEKRRLSIPHMGWNQITIKNNLPIFRDIAADDNFYFVHSYAVTTSEPSNILATTNYGFEFVSVLGKENIIGTQFHPEKSHSQGLKLLLNFINNF